MKLTINPVVPGIALLLSAAAFAFLRGGEPENPVEITVPPARLRVDGHAPRPVVAREDCPGPSATNERCRSIASQAAPFHPSSDSIARQSASTASGTNETGPSNTYPPDRPSGPRRRLTGSSPDIGHETTRFRPIGNSRFATDFRLTQDLRSKSEDPHPGDPVPAREKRHRSVADALADSDLSSLTLHERIAIHELADYVREASQDIQPAAEGQPDPTREAESIASTADEYLRITLGQDQFNRLSFLASRKVAEALNMDPTPQIQADD